MKTYKAILWDCDGVLIDSEIIACGVSASLFTELGFPVTTNEFVERFMGKGRQQILEEIRDESGLDLAAYFKDGSPTRQKLFEAFTKELKATPGIHEVMAEITLPMAVASGSDMERLHHTLDIAQLRDVFKGHIYSSELVAKGKPAPDIFLYAAEKLGVAPKDCLVIEDGIHGIHGAKAAGMDVAAYISASHMTEDLKEKVLQLQPDMVFTHISDLLNYIKLAEAA